MYLKIRRRDGIESLTILEEGKFKEPIDGWINCLSLFLGIKQFNSVKINLTNMIS